MLSTPVWGVERRNETAAARLAPCGPAEQAPVSPATPTHPPLRSSYGPTPTDTPLSAGGNLALGATPPAYPTYTPAPESAYPSPTATPVMWEAGLWMCPLCKGRFGAEGELVEHLLSAHVSKVPGVRVGGKTGTAQTDVSRKNYAWFTGFADDPKVAICVFIEDDAALDDLSGGAVAGPVFKSVLEAMR